MAWGFGDAVKKFFLFFAVFVRFLFGFSGAFVRYIFGNAVILKLY